MKTKGNYDHSRVQPDGGWGWGRCLQSGRYAQVLDTLFTSNLRTTTTVVRWGREGPSGARRHTYAATLIIWGLKASTCFRRAFMVFPVPTMAWRTDSSVGMQRKPDFQYVTLARGEGRSQAGYASGGFLLTRRV